MEFLPENNTVILLEGTGHKVILKNITEKKIQTNIMLVNTVSSPQVTRITRTSISVSERLRQTAHFSLGRGTLADVAVLVHTAAFAHTRAGERALRDLRESAGARDREAASARLTPHPRFVRYLGACFDPDVRREAHVLTDLVVGCSLLVSLLETASLDLSILF